MMMNLPPQITQYDPLEVARQQNVVQGGRTTNATALIQLEELRRQQETAARVRQHYQQNPGSLLGDPALLAPGAPGGMPGGGPLTQQTVMPGQPPGAPQPVPGGQDLSQFATQPGGGMPGGGSTSTLAGLAPQPQPRQNPLEALARTDPDAALIVQKQQQAQQEFALKRQEQQLTWGLKSIEAVAQMSQGVTNQADLDRARADMQQVAPQAAARLPQFYSKEGMEAFQQSALSVKERQTLQIADVQAQTDAVKAQADVIKARLSGRSTDVDNQLRAMGVAPGQETPPQMAEALKAVEEGKVRVSAAHGQGQIKETPFGAVRVGKSGETEFIQAPGGGPLYGKPTEAEQRAASFGARARAAHDNAVALEEKGLTPGIWSKVGEALPFGLGNYLVGEDQQRYRQAVSQFAQALLRKESGAAISPTEYTMTETTYFPQPGNSKKGIEDKRRERERIIQEMQEEGKGTGRTGGQGQPTSQAPTGTSGQGPATFDTADFAKWRQGAGKTGNPTAADVEAYFVAKGLKRK